MMLLPLQLVTLTIIKKSMKFFIFLTLLIYIYIYFFFFSLKSLDTLSFLYFFLISPWNRMTDFESLEENNKYDT